MSREINFDGADEIAIVGVQFERDAAAGPIDARHAEIGLGVDVAN